jgi:uncharacterized alpha-E superfamily protein
MLSRVAEHIYWMARYIERAESTARLINVNTFMMLDLPRGLLPGWEPLIHITSSEQEFNARYSDYSERAVARFLIGGSNHASSIIACLHSARENCRSVRDALPRVAWEELSDLYVSAKEDLQRGLTRRHRHDYLNRIIRGTQYLTGALDATLPRDDTYCFLQMGHQLERADMTTRIIDARTANLLPAEATELQPFESLQWMSVLNSLDAYHMYRKRQQTQVQRRQVLRFLVQDPHFPRSTLYSVRALRGSLRQLPNSQPALELLKGLERTVRNPQVLDLRQGTLHTFLDDLQRELIALHQSVNQTYFMKRHACAGAAQ